MAAVMSALKRAFIELAIDSDPGEEVLSFVIMIIEGGASSADVNDWLGAQFPSFVTLRFSAKASALDRIIGIVKSHGADRTVIPPPQAALNPMKSVEPASSSGTDHKSTRHASNIQPSSFWDEDAGTSSAQEDDFEEVEIELPLHLVGALETVRGVLPNCPIERVIEALHAAAGSADRAMTMLCDAEERARWTGSETAQMAHANNSEYERIIRQLRGDKHDGLPLPSAAGKGGKQQPPAAPGSKGLSGQLHTVSSGGQYGNAGGKRPASPVAAAPPASFAASAAPQPGPVPAQLVSQLRSLFDHLSAEQCQFALRKQNSDLELAAAYTMEDSFEQEFRLWHAARQRVAAASADAAASVSASGRRAEHGAVPLHFREYGGDEQAEDMWAVRSSVLRRFDETLDTRGKTYRPGLPAEMARTRRKGEKEVRYRDGESHHLPAGERFLDRQKPKTPVGDPSTFVALKIKRKRAAGPSPGFK